MTTNKGYLTRRRWELSPVCLLLALATVGPAQSATQPLVRVVDLNLGQQQVVELVNGTKVSVKLLELRETRDDVRSAMRSAGALVEVNNQRVEIACANYHLPISIAGVKIDCPITKGYLRDSGSNPWGLTRDARLRLWPADSPLIAPGTFVYPVKQRWFASATQMANEPVFVDRADCPLPKKKIYYHDGLDFGGAEGLIEVVAAVDALVISAGKEILPEHKDAPLGPRYDVVNLLDERGWYYRYSHLYRIDATIRVGRRVKIGQTLGILGKEGGSGGWAHLHFAIKSMQPSGLWGTQEAYAFVWEAYHRQYAPKLIAVARPHHICWAGQTVTLDGTRSWSASGKIHSYEWTFINGETAAGATVKRQYDQPGAFSEILKVTDTFGRVSYDFAVVYVMDKEHPDWCIPTIHPTFAPTQNIRPGDPVTFKVRTFGTTSGNETWNFGDGSPQVTVCSDGNVESSNPDGYAIARHIYQEPGQYLVKVQRTDEHGFTAIAHLYVPVGQPDK